MNRFRNVAVSVALIVGLFTAVSVWANGTKEAKAKTVTLRFAIVSGPAQQMNQAIEVWSKKVAKDTNGQLKIVLLGSGQLGGERSYIEGMQLGNIEMAQVSTGPLSSFIPQFEVMSLPYVFTSYKQIDQAINGPIGKRLFKLLGEKGITGLTWFTNGFRSVFNSEKPIHDPANLKGMKIRVMQSPLMVASLNAMGASATPMAYGELYTALQQGVVQGAENAPGNMLNDKFYEVAKYLSLTRHFAPPGVVAISTKVYDRLPVDLQKYLVKSAKWLGEYERSHDKKNQEEAIKELKAKGVKVNTVDISAFRQAVQPVIQKYSNQIGPYLMNLVRKEMSQD